MGGLQYVGFIIPILLLMVWLEYYVSKKKKVDAYTFSDTMVNMCCGLLERLTDFFVVFMLYFILDFFEQFAFWTIPNTALTFLMVLMVSDFAAYWHHRLSHEINFMWAAHIVHHQSEELNLTTVFRVSSFAIFNRMLFWWWIPLLGFSSEIVIASTVFIGLFQFVTHSRLVGKLGFLEKIFVTPSHHRVHHARNPEYIDQNYGHVFIIWDKMLGTFVPETEEPEFGIVKGFESSNPYFAYFSYWLDLFKRAGKMNNLKDKVLVFIKPPDWTGEGEEFDLPEFQTDESGKRLKYKNQVPFRLQLYIFINVMIIFAAFILLLLKGDSDLTSLQVGTLVAFIVYSVLSMGFLLEQKNIAVAIELIRLPFILIALPLIFYYLPYGMIVIGIGTVVHLVFVVWLLRLRNYFKSDKNVNPTVARS